GIWFEQAKNRLWITSAQDYTNENHRAKVTIVTLGENGRVTVAKRFTLNVPAKRVYGGCNAVPAALVEQLGGPYVCGWGGYTSLVNQGGGAPTGRRWFSFPDPAPARAGPTVRARPILAPSGARGGRLPTPPTYSDAGDP